MSSVLRPRLRIFVSHSHTDTVFGPWLVQKLQGALNDDDTIFYDSEGGLRPGDNWFKVIRKKLETCNVFIVLLSKAAIRSKYVLNELDIIRVRHVKGRVRFIAILCEDFEPPADIINVYQVIKCFSPVDYQTAFNEVLRGLDLPLDLGDLGVDPVQQAINRIEVAFTSGESIVI